MDALFQRGLGMQFDTADGRERYFGRAQRDVTSVPLGAAFSHAASTNLGAWGSETALREDCAQIMAFEVSHLARRRGVELTGPVSKEDVLRTNAFQAAFESARHGPDAILQDLVTSMGVQGRLGRHEGREPRGPRISVENAHQVVFDELVQRHQLPV